MNNDWPCPGIQIEPGSYSGCSGGSDCPTCRGELVLATTAASLIAIKTHKVEPDFKYVEPDFDYHDMEEKDK
jgi:hypothetical protein